MGGAVDNYLERFRSLGLDGVPCSEAETEQLEHAVGVPLPAAYKAFLRIAGRHPPSAWIGSDCTIGSLPELRGWAEDLLAECGQPPLPAREFVFLMHQGYEFFYFMADGSSDDPPLFSYLEGEPEVVKKYDRFSDLVLLCAGDGQAD